MVKKTMFYSHVICLGTKIWRLVHKICPAFYSHVICLGTKIEKTIPELVEEFYSHVICLGTKIITPAKRPVSSFTVT